ncbi:MAG TPA: alpha-hydroxy-acid oxidizing protein [Bryobacteraceae bacterium]|nr:alpha-hydroxy-acid oxidizing protein [Bryobacteraceae bacterium]
MTRRKMLLAGASALQAQRLAPPEELVNTLEMEAAAQTQLAPRTFAAIAGSDREAFDRITFRPRLMVNTLGMDLSVTLFGEKHFAPILIGPLAEQRRFHGDGEQAMRAGAQAAKATVIWPARTSVPLEELQPQWVEADARRPEIPTAAKVVVVTAPFHWDAVAALCKRSPAPVLCKGVMHPADARAALQQGAAGIVVSNYRASGTDGLASPIEALPAIAREVAGEVPILMDGSIRRGSDILKALALGARAVCIGRPALWGLAAYGAAGVRQVIDQLQTELARDMAMCGLARCADASPANIRIHRRR